jgi:hypothetical protein
MKLSEGTIFGKQVSLIHRVNVYCAKTENIKNRGEFTIQLKISCKIVHDF